MILFLQLKFSNKIRRTILIIYFILKEIP